MIRHPDVTAGYFDELLQQLAEGELPDWEVECGTVDGNPYWTEMIFDRVMNNKGEVVGYTAIMHDISDKKYIEQLSITDSLTGLFNRMKIDDVLNNESTRSSRYGSSLSILLFDIDYFKKINDTFGHQVGDTTLIAVAEIIMARTREVDIAGRWGGEEFMIICPQTGMKGASELAEELRIAISAHKLDEVDEVTCSFGVAEYNRGEHVTDLLMRADMALYKAKKGGRNRVVIAD
jgi:diguanylate cyclase (GGDEF)-like protein